MCRYTSACGVHVRPCRYIKCTLVHVCVVVAYVCFLLEQVPLRRDRPHPVGADPPTRIMRRTGKCARKAAHAAGEKRPATAPSRIMRVKAIQPFLHLCGHRRKAIAQTEIPFYTSLCLETNIRLSVEPYAPLQACTRSVEQLK